MIIRKYNLKTMGMLVTLALCLCLTIQKNAQAVIPGGATGHYVLDGDATDSSGLNAHGILGDAATHPTFALDATRGKQVATFDGIDDFIDVTASGNTLTSQDLGAPDASPEDILQFTVGFWARFDSLGSPADPDANIVMGTHTSNLGAGRVTIELVGNGSWNNFGPHGNIGIVGGPSSGNSQAFKDSDNGGAGAINLFDDQWHHVVMSWADPDTDPTNHNVRAAMSVWIDNNLADSSHSTFGGGDRGNVKLLLGSALGSCGNSSCYPDYFSGSLSDVIFYNRVLDEDEVSGLFEATSSTGGGDPVPGDTDDDDDVDADDLNNLLANYGSGLSFGAPFGDFDGDNQTGLSDLLILKKNFGTVPTPAPVATAVPEPMSIVLAALGLLGVCVCRLRRSAKGCQQ